MLEAGMARVDITPADSVPLAGYFTLKSRISEGVRDRLYARAIAFRDKDLTVLLLIYDLLMTTEEMVQKLRGRLEDTGARIIVTATHTHSAPGGYWDSFVPRIALGAYDPEALDRLCAFGEEAARLAMEDLDDCRISVHQGQLPQLAKNRRDADGPLDDGLWALCIDRSKTGKGKAIMTGFPGHPVIVAERAFKQVSADFPGEVIRRIEEQVEFGAFINGALGGVDVFFPDEDISADENLDLQAAPIAEEALKVKGEPLKGRARLRFASREIDNDRKPAVQMFFDDQPLHCRLALPLNRAVSAALSTATIDQWRVQAIAIADILILGTPADLGVSVSLAIQQYAREKGFKAPFVVSQCDGYIGYIHRSRDYVRTPGKETRGMAYYENILAIFGRDMGEVLIDQARSLIDELAP